jgi:hypothetical protein
VEDVPVKPRQVGVLVGALVIGVLSPLAAQEPVQTPDTGQVYAPTPPAAQPAPAPAAVPYVPPSNAPAAGPAANTPVTQSASGRTVAQSLGFIDVIPIRSPDRIRTEIEAAKAAAREADARITESSSQQAQTKAMVEVKKQELSTVNARIKLAEKQKAEADKITLEAEKKVSERQKQFLERRQALHSAELDRARAGKKLASAQQKALELELQLSQRHADRAAVTDPTTALRSDQVIRELERKTLEAQRQQADAAKDVAARDEDIAKRRLDLYQAQMAAGSVR